MTYKRLYGLSQDEFNREMLRGYQHLVNFDFKHARKETRKYACTFNTELQGTGERSMKVGSGYRPKQFPEEYGFNAILLDSLVDYPEARRGCRQGCKQSPRPHGYHHRRRGDIQRHRHRAFRGAERQDAETSVPDRDGRAHGALPDTDAHRRKPRAAKGRIRGFPLRILGWQRMKKDRVLASSGIFVYFCTQSLRILGWQRMKKDRVLASSGIFVYFCTQ